MSGYDMQSLGEALRRAREHRGLTVEKAERETRIRAKFLVGMENGDLSEIPSRVQARGFLYNYAQYLGLNPGDIVAQFDAIHGGIAPPPPHQDTSPPYPSYPPQTPPTQPVQVPAYPQFPQVPPPSYPSGPQSPPPSQQTRPIPRIPTIIPPAIQRMATPPQPIPTPLPGVPTPDSGTPPPAPQTLLGRLLASDLFLISMLALVAVLVLGIGGRALGNLPRGEANGKPSTFLENLSNSQPTGTVTPTFAPTSTPTATIPPLAADRVRVSFEVTQRNWMRVEVDGEAVFEGLAEPGTILQYEGLQQVRVVAGNGAGLSVTYNGVELGPLGEQALVAEQIYTMGGLETLTPTPSPPPTSTAIPTATEAGGASSEPQGTAAPPESP